MSSSPTKVAAFEYFDPSSAEYSATSSSLNQANSGESSPPIPCFTNTFKAIETQEKKIIESNGLLSNLRPKLEKFGAMKPDEVSAANLKASFRKIAKQMQIANKLLDETNKNMCEWASTFESDEVSKLSFEFSKYLQLNYNMNEMIADRFEHIGFRLKTISKQENRRDQFVIKNIKAKRELDLFKKKSTDINMTSSIYDKLKFSTSSLSSAQNLLEQSVRSSLRPAMFGYVYVLNKYSNFINELSRSTTMDLRSFERKLDQHDSILREQLSISDSKYLKKPCFDIAQKYELEYKEKVSREIYSGEAGKSGISVDNAMLRASKQTELDTDEEESEDDSYDSNTESAEIIDTRNGTFTSGEAFNATLAPPNLRRKKGKKKQNAQINTSENHTLKVVNDNKSNCNATKNASIT